MKKYVALLAALLIGLMTCAGAQGMMSDEELTQIAQADYPGWQIWRNTWYGSGPWEDGLAIHAEIGLLRVDEDALLLRELHTIKNPLRSGDSVPWTVTDYAPVPLTQEAAQRLAALEPTEVMERFDGPEVNQQQLDGCAGFLLGDGELLEALYVYPDFLVAEIRDEAGREGLRIAHWDGAAYTGVTSTALSARRMDVVSVHSFNDYLEVGNDGGEVVLCCGEDGQWYLAHVVTYDEDYDETAYSISGDGISVYDYFYSDYRNNDWLYYGRPTFPTLLNGLSFDDIPTEIDEAVALLDATGYACVKTEGAGLYEAPEGQLLASCYARLTGTVLQEQDDWVQLQIGSAQEGMTGWFRREDMAFGAEVNQVVCSFPAYDDGAWWDLDSLESILPECGAALDPWSTELWLIARLPDGDWLALVNGDMVCEAPAEAIGEVGPTYHEWEADWEEEDW